MPATARRALAFGAGVLLVLGVGAGVFFLRVDRVVSREAAPARARAERVRPLSFVAVERETVPGEVAGDGRVLGVAEVAGGLLLATGSGVREAGRSYDVLDGLPSLRVSAVASWRGTAVFALERGGWGRLGAAGPELATTAFGELEVRTFVETEGGELLVGARQGLYRASFGAGEIEKLDDAPVRSIALPPGGEIASGGERGLRLVSRGGAVPRLVATPDPWVESVVVLGDELWVATAAGAARGRPDATILVPVPRGADATAGVAWDGALCFVPADGPPRVSALMVDGSRRETPAPERFLRLFAASGRLFADGPSGLRRFDRARGFELVRAAPPALPKPHVNALAADGTRLYLGFFDGALAAADPRSTPLVATAFPSGEAWGVNALLPMGSVVYAATLRGAFRITGGEARLLEGAGAAFALAATGSGLAVGYGLGVLLPGPRLLSAFHGLPGNQAYALAATGEALWVGTPTGLGRVERRRVTERVLPGEGKLPHPWVTALSPREDGLWVATYGGGLAVRRAGDAGPTWESFPETRGLKVNAGALLGLPDGRLCAGTQGSGVWCSDRLRSRFSRVDLPLPSPDVFALAAFPRESPDLLFVGTSEGLLRLPADALPETR
jgi:ligand-binding sensor domain-containing protein